MRSFRRLLLDGSTVIRYIPRDMTCTAITETWSCLHDFVFFFIRSIVYSSVYSFLCDPLKSDCRCVCVCVSCKWNDECVMCILIFFCRYSVFGSCQKTPFVTDKTWKTNVFWRLLFFRLTAKRKEKYNVTKAINFNGTHIHIRWRRSAPSATNTHTHIMSIASFDRRGKCPSERNAFLHFVDRALLCTFERDFAACFFLFLFRWRSYGHWWLGCRGELERIKTQSKPIARAHSMWCSSGIGRAYLSAIAGRVG